jgi:arabinan endo-1,5-alpha-L-arabinosidase
MNICSILANYSNPIINKVLPDPTVIKASDGYFYLYTTEDSIRNTPIFKSKNLVKWEQVGTAFNDSSRPSFVANGNIWAPDINYINGKYVMYYALSTWEDAAHAGLGVATADKPEGPFKDLGKLFLSSEIGVTQSIDAVYFEEDGKHYLFWGSYHGIYAIELESDGLKVKSGASKRKVFGDIFEASIIHKRGNYYYLIAAWGDCCSNTSSTYRIVGGRGTSLFGTYYDKNGKDLLNGGYSVFLVF